MSATKRLALIAALLPACLEQQSVALDFAADAIVVVAIVREGESIPQEARVTRGDAARFTGEPGDEAVAWVLEDGHLIDEHGAPLGVDDIEAHPVGGARSTGACGRCLVSAYGGRQLLLAGDSCPVPNAAPYFSTPSLEQDRIAVIRSAVRIERTGDCACAPPAMVRGRRLGIELTGFRPDPEPIEAVVERADGAVGLFAATYAKLIAPDGTVRQLGRASGGWCDARRPPFGDNIRGAVTVADGRFIVLSARDDFRDGVVHALDDELDATELDIRGANIEFDPHELRAGPDPDEITLLGAAGRAPVAAAAYRCRVTAGLDCSPLFDPRALHGGGHASDVSVGAPTVVVDSAGGWLARWDGPIEGLIAEPGPTVVEASGQLVRITRLFAVGRVGDRLWACGHSRTAVGAHVITASITASPLPIRWSRSLVIDSGCTNFLEEPDGSLFMPMDLRVSNIPRALHMGTVSTATVVADLNARLGIVGALDGVADMQTGSRAILRADGAVHLRRSGQTVRVHGPEARQPGHVITAVYADGDGFGGFGGANRYRITPRRDGPTRIETSSTTGLAPTDLARAAAVDSAAGDVVVVGRGEQDSVWIARVDQLGRATKLALPDALGEIDIIDITEASPGRLVAVGAFGAILLIQGDRVQQLEIDWDDPETEAVESAPGSNRLCGIAPHLGPSWQRESDLWRTVSGDGHGVAWVGGCRDALVRVVVVGDRPHAVRVSLSRFEDGLPGRALGTVTGGTMAICGDRVAIAHQHSLLVGGVAAAISVHSWDEPPALVTANPLPNVGRSPIAIVGRPDAATVVSNWGHALSASVFGADEPTERWTGRMTLFRVVANDAGTVLAAGDFGRLLIGHVCE